MKELLSHPETAGTLLWERLWNAEKCRPGIFSGCEAKRGFRFAPIVNGG